MFFELIRCFKGSCVVSVSGRFPERILNLASNNSIYIESVKKDKDGKLYFKVSKKAYLRLKEILPEDLELNILQRFGIPFFINRYKRRFVLYILPGLFICAAWIFSLFLWRVNIYGGDEALRQKVFSQLKENGVYVGAQKSKIVQYDVKRNLLMNLDGLSWVWVEIKGTTAHVRLHERTKVPETENINEPGDVIATHSGVIEKMQTFCGAPLAAEGDTVEKGQVIVTGVFQSENENIPVYFHHAKAAVTARVWDEKSVNIPKYSYIKVPTGRKKSVYGINFKKNNVNFSLNSGISYSEYDKIEKKLKLPVIPIAFTKTQYYEVNVTAQENNIEELCAKYAMEFQASLEKGGAQQVTVTSAVEDKGEYVLLSMRSERLMRIDKEIPIDKENIRRGEQDG